MRYSAGWLCLYGLFQVATAAVLGIDYGQEYVKAVVVAPNAPLEVVLTPEAKRKDLSGLAIRSLGAEGNIERVYGSAVGSLATRFPQNSLLRLKALLGKTWDDQHVISLYLRAHPGVNITESARNSIAFDVDGKQYLVEEIVAMNLQEVVNRANNHLKEKDPKTLDTVTQLGITIHHNFDQHQRQALLDAASMVTGPQDVVLVNDGTSVAIDFARKSIDNWEVGKRYFYIIYDMGSGSTEASLFSVYKPENTSQPLQIEFGGYGYNPELGGSMLTRSIADLVEGKFLEAHPEVRTETLHGDARSIAKIYQAAEKAKLVLSANSDATISLESLTGDVDFRTKILRKEFEDYLQDILPQVVQPIDDALTNQWWEEAIDMKSLSGVLLTGGSSRVPIVQEYLTSYLGKGMILRSVNADESAVNGAAIKSVQLFNAFKTRPMNTTERSFFDYSISVSDAASQKTVFPASSTYPSKKSVIIRNNDDTPNTFQIGLHECGMLFQYVTIEADTLSQTFTRKKCSSGLVYNVTLELDANKLFHVSNVDALCLQKSSTLKAADIIDQVADISDTEFQQLDEKSHIKQAVVFNVKNTPIERMSSIEILRSKGNNQLLDTKDKERFLLHEAKNELEATLYDARNYLEDENVLKDGPPVHVDQLANLVPLYIEWLEEEADASTKSLIDEKKEEVNVLKKKIEFYINTINEPLDEDQFKDLLEVSQALLQNITMKERIVNEAVADYTELFAELGYDVQKEFKKINLPRFLTSSLSNWNETLTSLSKLVPILESMVGSGTINDLEREELFEMKVLFDSSYQEVADKLEYYYKGLDYRVKELEAFYQRKLRAQKRKEERIRKRMEQQTNSTTKGASLGEWEDEKSGVSINTTKDSAFSASSKTTTSSQSSSEEIQHDEL